MASKILHLLLVFLPCALMDDGVVLKLSATEEEGSHIHMWVQRDPDNPKDGDFYKLYCTFAKNPSDNYVVKLYFKDTLLETLLVTKFDEDLLDSIMVLKKEDDEYKIRYDMTEDSSSDCLVRTYKPRPQGFTTSDSTCTRETLAYIRMNVDPWAGWKWDMDDTSMKFGGVTRGAVGVMGLQKRKEDGMLLHTWKNKRPGYTLAVRLIQQESSLTYLATVRYREAVLDIMEVNSLGEELTHSITALGMDDGSHILQYRKIDGSCTRRHYDLEVVGESYAKLHYKDIVYEPDHRPCQRLMIRTITNKVQKIVSSPKTDNGWMW